MTILIWLTTRAWKFSSKLPSFITGSSFLASFLSKVHVDFLHNNGTRGTKWYARKRIFNEASFLDKIFSVGIMFDDLPRSIYLLRKVNPAFNANLCYMRPFRGALHLDGWTGRSAQILKRIMMSTWIETSGTGKSGLTYGEVSCALIFVTSKFEVVAWARCRWQITWRAKIPGLSTNTKPRTTGLTSVTIGIVNPL